MGGIEVAIAANVDPDAARDNRRNRRRRNIEPDNIGLVENRRVRELNF